MPDRFVIPVPARGPFSLGPDSHRQPGVPQGTVTKAEWRSTIFPGTIRDYWLYVPAQYTPDKPASLMVFQDGSMYATEESRVHTPVVFDNLIHQGKMPVTLGLFVNAGQFAPTAPGREPVSNRLFEYMPLTDQYARFLLEELMPEVERNYRISPDPEQRAICGISAGAVCAWTVAWQRPDAFRKVLSHVGSFAYVLEWPAHNYPFLIRKTPRKPIRVYLQAGSNDLDHEWGHWPLLNLHMAAALNFAGYDYHLEYGDGAHDIQHGGAILPESLVWLWR
jgi:enterochelin esterase-like enzyme